MSATQFLQDAKGKLLWSATSQEWSAHVTPRECEALLAHILKLEGLAEAMGVRVVPPTGLIDSRDSDFFQGEGDEQE